MVSEANMEALMRLNASRAGHDKLVRSAQYACRSPLNDDSFYRENLFRSIFQNKTSFESHHGCKVTQ